MGKYGKWDLAKNKDGEYRLLLYPSNGHPEIIMATFREETMKDIIKKYESLR